MSYQMADLNLQRRKALARLILGGASVLTLAACGGGGGGDSNSDRVEALKAAYYKLEDGMVWTDAEALVGFPANYIRNDTDLQWTVGDVTLGVGFETTGRKWIVGAFLRTSPSSTVSRNFQQ
jgi:hypothetical protein